MNKDAVSMTTRIEITQKLKHAYKTAPKQEKTLILNQFCNATGLGRSTARRYLTNTNTGNKRIHRPDRRTHKPTKYSTATKKQLTRIWRLMGMPSGKYLKAVLPEWLQALEDHNEIKLTAPIRDELLTISAATIDRYLKPERDKLAFKGISTTKPGTLLRNSITIRKATDELETEPGFFEADTVAHSGPTLKGEFTRTLTLTDVVTGWIHLEVLRNNARTHMLAGLNRAAATIPYDIAGLDCDNGSEFINHQVIEWAAAKLIFFTRSRPYKKNDQACVESKNNHAVRRYGFHYRYDTDSERATLSHLWEVVCLKLNYFTATRKPVGWTHTQTGKRRRVYDTPKTPYQRVLESGILSKQQQESLATIYRSINPAELTRQILYYQNRLISLAEQKTQTMQTQILQKQRERKLAIAKQTGTGIRIKTS